MFDYSDSAFSPPADDTFFLIRYPKPASSSSADINKEGFRSISEFLAGKRDTASSVITDTSSNSNSNDLLNKQPSFQQSLSSYGTATKINEPKFVIANNTKINKPINEFNNDKTSEATGRSIVTVASQIMFGKSNIANNSSFSSDIAQQQQQSSIESSVQEKEQTRKVSKSLPATPLTSPNITPDSSPKARRRGYGNRFFTGAFVPDGERQKNGWLLGSILGQSRELVVTKIEEEDELTTPEQIPPRALSRKKSISSQNLTYISKDDKSGSIDSTTSQILQAQPSELREMNFWSPTSM
ncbi:uncharacterized protein LOC106645305 isoform X2 [Copidosoma floridanum]|uniref:uncharacterized protein LOC106645305 isoform X2 n=1 Tax=Copidosoma floridanum TaxID=29053 RepID=UPI0006C95D56|nr:uncharacterized protein LOC106645305 isoform X2 [Copidosoma floridanum]